MRKFMVCLLAVIGQFCSVHSMCCNVPLTESQQRRYDELVVSCKISDLRNVNSQLAETLKDDDFWKTLERFVTDAEQVSDFVSDSRSKSLKGVDEIIVRAALCREGGSLLASFADLIRQDTVREKIANIASNSLMARMKKIGLIRSF